MERTIFDDIVEGKVKSWPVWENDEFIAFLTRFPNTPGFTIVIPKKNPGDYVFGLTDELYVRFMEAIKEVAHILEKAFSTPRVALIFEGTGVAYVHAKLIPLHGDLAGQTDVWSPHKEFSEEYRGWFTSAEGPEMDEDRLTEIQAQIRSVQ